MFEIPTVSLSALCDSFSKIAYFSSSSSRFFVGAAASKMRASSSSCVFFFFKLRSSSLPQTKFKGLSLDCRCVYRDRAVWICRFKQLFSELDTYWWTFFFHNDRCYHLPKYWPFLLNHLVYWCHWHTQICLNNVVWRHYINLLKPTGYVMHQQV